MKIAGQLPIADSAEKPGVDGGAAVPPLKKHVEFSVFGRVSGPLTAARRFFSKIESIARTGNQAYRSCMRIPDRNPASNVTKTIQAIWVIGCLLIIASTGSVAEEWPRTGGTAGQPAVTNAPPPVEQDYPIANGHWVSLVLDWGAKVKLEDGSVWAIATKDQYKTRNWLVAQKISANPNPNDRYPFKLTNTDLKATADARLESRSR